MGGAHISHFSKPRPFSFASRPSLFTDEYMAFPINSSPIVSYGGTATSSFFLSSTTTTTPALTGFYASNFVHDHLNTCGSHQVARIRNALENENEDEYLASEEHRRGALFCRSGTWLQLTPNDVADDTKIHVHGTKDENSPFSIVQFISVAMGLISIRGVDTKHFLCMDPSGKLYATPTSNYSTECVFVEEMMENYYNLYSSCRYGSRQNPWYVELRRSGKPRRGPNTKKRRKASHFLVVHHDLRRLRHPTLPNGNDVSDLVVASLFHQPPSHPLFSGRISPTKPPASPSHRISNLRAKVEVNGEIQRQKEADDRKRRREKKKRRREERLLREEQQRRDRQLELYNLRAEELRQSRPHRYTRRRNDDTPRQYSSSKYPKYLY